MRWFLVTTLLATFSTQTFGEAIAKRSLLQSFSSNPIFQRVFNGPPGASLASKFLQNPNAASFSPASNVVVYYNSDEIPTNFDEQEGSDSADSSDGDSNSIEIGGSQEEVGEKVEGEEEDTTTTTQEPSTITNTEKLYSSEITTPRHQIFNANIGGNSPTITTTEENPVTTSFPQSTTHSTTIVSSDFSNGSTSTQRISNSTLPPSTTTTSEVPELSTFSPTVEVDSTPTSTQAGTISSSTSTTEIANKAEAITSQTLGYQVATTTGRSHLAHPQPNPFSSYSNVYASTITSKPFHHRSGNSSRNSTEVIPGHLYKSSVIPGFFPSQNNESHHTQPGLPVYYQKPSNQTEYPANITQVDSYRITENASNGNGTKQLPDDLYQSSFIVGFFPNQDNNNSDSQRPQEIPPGYYQTFINRTQVPKLPTNITNSPGYYQTSMNRTQVPKLPTNITRGTNPYNIAFQTLLQQGNRTGRPRRPDPITEFMTNFFGLIGRSKRSVDHRNLLRISRDSVASKFIAPKYFPKFADYELPERRHTLPKYILNNNRRVVQKMDRVSLRELFNKDFSRKERDEKDMPRFIGSFEQIL